MKLQRLFLKKKKELLILTELLVDINVIYIIFLDHHIIKTGKEFIKDD